MDDTFQIALHWLYDPIESKRVMESSIPVCYALTAATNG